MLKIINWNGYIGEHTPLTIHTDWDSEEARFDLPTFKRAMFGYGERCAFPNVQVYDVNTCVSIVQSTGPVDFDAAVRWFHESPIFQGKFVNKKVQAARFKKDISDYPVFLYQPFQQ